MTPPDEPAETARPSALARARRVVAKPPSQPAAADPASPQEHVEHAEQDARSSVARSSRPRPKTSIATLRAETARPTVAFRSVEEPAAAQEPEPKKSRAGRDLPAAIGVGLGLAGLIIASLFVYRPSFAVIVGVAVLYGVYELGRALGTEGIRISLGPLLVGSAAMLVAAWERGTNGLATAALVTVAAVLIWRIADGAKGYTRDVCASSLVLLYVPTLAGFAVLLAHPHDGAGRVIAFVATVVCSDTGGYAAGVLFGKHPLAPVVSKAKTWEGFTGSVIACSAAGVLLMMFTFHESWWKGLLFGLAVVVTATLGDLGESMIKRDLDIKDMGTLLPGHGGLMDRLDSLLPCAAVSYLILSAFHPV